MLRSAGEREAYWVYPGGVQGGIQGGIQGGTYPGGYIGREATWLYATRVGREAYIPGYTPPGYIP